jgi:predicted  nucleic acid-binding Zn-ribbon protein
MTENPMHDDLVRLLDLQAKDVALLDVDTRLASVLAEIDVLDQAIRGVQNEADAAGRAAQDAARRRDEMEQKIESYRRLQEQRRKRLEFTRAAKEAASMTAELDLATSVLAKEESDWIRVADAVTAQQAAAAAAQGRVAEARAAQQPERDEVDLRRVALENERTAALAEREAAGARLERRLRTRYDKLRAHRGRNVVVAMKGAGCGACFTAIPLHRRSQLRESAGYDWCEACGVILFFDAESLA